MNQDQVRAALLELHKPTIDFIVIFSGKSNGRVNAIYKPASHEIVIHNQNFNSPNALFYTAMHEYAHHIMVTEKGASGSRSHTNAFWATLHDLAGIAEAKGLYQRAAKAEPMAEVNASLVDLIRQSGEILKQIGRALIQAQKICDANGVRFEDYIQRDLKQTLPWAMACMKAATYDLPPELGAENLKTVSTIKDPVSRAAAADALAGELSPQQVKTAKAAKSEPGDPAARIRVELDRITRTISHLVQRQEELSRALEEVGP